MSSAITCKRLEFGSDEYLESVELRKEILRKPLGLDFHPEDLKGESDQVHLAAYSGDKLLAILLLKTMKDLGESILKMRQVAVNAEVQGQGVGKCLVAFSEKWAIENGYDTIDLHARKTAVDFYKSMNYTIIGNEFLEVGIPHLRMVKTLKS